MSEAAAAPTVEQIIQALQHKQAAAQLYAPIDWQALAAAKSGPAPVGKGVVVPGQQPSPNMLANNYMKPIGMGSMVPQQVAR